MSFTIPGFTITRLAAEDLSASQFRFVAINSSGQAALVTTAGGGALGVVQNDPAVGEAATIMLDGVSKVVAGAAVAAGADIASDTEGRAVAASTNNRILGIALEEASSAGAIIAVALVRGAGTA